MANIGSYFKHQEERLKGDFEIERTSHTSPSVKGSANEKIVSEFLRKHISDKYIATRVEIIDSFGNASDEVDICVCNSDQPFGEDPGQILIAEGVDFVIQVKATLKSGEVDRIISNCFSVKKLCRMFSDDTYFLFNEPDIPYFVKRIPYIVLAFSSPRLDTVRRNFKKKLSNIALEHQPDAVFILGVGAIYNDRQGKVKGWKYQGKRLPGLNALGFGEQTLLEFMRYLHELPRFYRMRSPLVYYFTRTYQATLGTQGKR